MVNALSKLKPSGSLQSRWCENGARLHRFATTPFVENLLLILLLLLFVEFLSLHHTHSFAPQIETLEPRCGSGCSPEKPRRRRRLCWCLRSSISLPSPRATACFTPPTMSLLARWLSPRSSKTISTRPGTSPRE